MAWEKSVPQACRCEWVSKRRLTNKTARGGNGPHPTVPRRATGRVRARAFSTFRSKSFLTMASWWSAWQLSHTRTLSYEGAGMGSVLAEQKWQKMCPHTRQWCGLPPAVAAGAPPASTRNPAPPPSIRAPQCSAPQASLFP